MAAESGCWDLLHAACIGFPAIRVLPVLPIHGNEPREPIKNLLWRLVSFSCQQSLRSDRKAFCRKPDSGQKIRQALLRARSLLSYSDGWQKNQHDCLPPSSVLARPMRSVAFQTQSGPVVRKHHHTSTTAKITEVTSGDRAGFILLARPTNLLIRAVQSATVEMLRIPGASQM